MSTGEQREKRVWAADGEREKGEKSQPRGQTENYLNSPIMASLRGYSKLSTLNHDRVR